MDIILVPEITRLVYSRRPLLCVHKLRTKTWVFWRNVSGLDFFYQRRILTSGHSLRFDVGFAYILKKHTE